MTRVATIDTRKWLSLVVAAAMVIAMVMALILPSVADAAYSEGITGQFQISGVVPTITEEAALYNSGHTGGVLTSMDPLTQYSLKVTIADDDTINNLNIVTVTIFYDEGVDDDPAEIPTADTQDSFVMTCTVGGANGAWAGNPSSSTTWDIVEASCVQPTLTLGSGTFWFNFVPGEVATEALDWDVYIQVVDDNTNADAYYDGSDYDMNWYGEIDVTTASIDWGIVSRGMDFDHLSAKETVAVTYTSNGPWDAQVSTTSPWGVATLDETGATANANEFALKAWKTDAVLSADLVTDTASECPIDETGTQTVEGGYTNSSNTVYLRLASLFTGNIYSGTITFTIANGS